MLKSFIGDSLASVQRFFAQPLWSNRWLLLGVWLLLALLAGVAKMAPERCNNFLIFAGTFHHSMQQLPLYAYYPDEYFDHNLYGPLFGLLMAPFALLPHPAGLLLWVVALAAALFAAVGALPGRKGIQTFIYWFCLHELLTALFMQQFNVAIAAIIVGAFALVEREQEVWAALLIMTGAMVKVYGLAALAFFFFSKHKVRFVLSCVGWGVLLFVAPMLLSSPAYVVTQYGEWVQCLMDKEGLNQTSLMQNISLLGFVHRTTGWQFSDLYLIVPGGVLFLLPYLRRKAWQHQAFRYAYLASALLFVVLFSSGSESSGYIIALVGVVVWYTTVPWRRGGWDVALMVLAFVLTSLSPSDLFPRYLREQFVQPYALKALPCIIVWFKLQYEMLSREYAPRTA